MMSINGYILKKIVNDSSEVKLMLNSEFSLCHHFLKFNLKVLCMGKRSKLT